jgi:hypothetical protein
VAAFRAQDTATQQFIDLTERSKIGFVNQSSRTSRKYLTGTMVGGAAMLDHCNDGLLDLFFVNGAELKDPLVGSIGLTSLTRPRCVSAQAGWVTPFMARTPVKVLIKKIFWTIPHRLTQ